MAIHHPTDVRLETLDCPIPSDHDGCSALHLIFFASPNANLTNLFSTVQFHTGTFFLHPFVYVFWGVAFEPLYSCTTLSRHQSIFVQWTGKPITNPRKTPLSAMAVTRSLVDLIDHHIVLGSGLLFGARIQMVRARSIWNIRNEFDCCDWDHLHCILKT